jgi:hypothetical protein
MLTVFELEMQFLGLFPMTLSLKLLCSSCPDPIYLYTTKIMFIAMKACWGFKGKTAHILSTEIEAGPL